jgi:hypothetical protein
MHEYDQPEQKKKVMSDNDQADFVMQVTLNLTRWSWQEATGEFSSEPKDNSNYQLSIWGWLKSYGMSSL